MVSEDQKFGTIIAKAEVSQTSYGESIAIFVESVPQKRATHVEIVNKRASVARLFTRDWEGILAKRLDDALK